ncbi:MAG: hypothetical protein AAB873_03090 [Patescibacteria group bacterium]
MISKWFSLKNKSIALRKKGISIRSIEKYLKIPRSTLSGWFKNVKLTKTQMKVLEIKHKNALIKGRKKAMLWHNQQKSKRILNAENEANKILSKLDNNSKTIELGLAMLYLGEGFKKSPRTGMGNSDPLLLRFFLKILINVYKVKKEKIRFELHIRADQNPVTIKKYWAKELKISINDFRSVSVDKRTIGKPTYKDYNGVCVIDCGNIAIQRKLIYIGRKFCERSIETLGG